MAVSFREGNTANVQEVTALGIFFGWKIWGFFLVEKKKLSISSWMDGGIDHPEMLVFLLLKTKFPMHSTEDGIPPPGAHQFH